MYGRLFLDSSFDCEQVQQKEQLEQRILKQENEISNMENRNYFSLLCVQLETQLIHANLEGVYIALHIMATVEAKTHSEVGFHLTHDCCVRMKIITESRVRFFQLALVWDHIQPMIDNLLPRDINKNNPAATSGNGVTSSIHRSQSQPSSA